MTPVAARKTLDSVSASAVAMREVGFRVNFGHSTAG